MLLRPGYEPPQVYGYLLPRCSSTVVAEDLTAETFMAAVAVLAEEVADPWDEHLDVQVAHAARQARERAAFEERPGG